MQKREEKQSFVCGQNYQLKIGHYFNVLCKPYGNHKAKICSQSTKIKRMESKHNTPGNRQITKDDSEIE